MVSAGVLMLVVGFVLLGQGPADSTTSLTIAPIILVLAYLVVIPLGIIWGGQSKDESKGD